MQFHYSIPEFGLSRPAAKDGNLGKCAKTAQKKRLPENGNRTGQPNKLVGFYFVYFASMVETHMVISSRTSKSARTVSSDVKTVTLFSTAQRRIMLPSEFMSALP